MKNDKFLPIGTVVLLKNATKKLMITSYAVYPTGKQYANGKLVETQRKVYDYGSCEYPIGILDFNTVHAFNHQDIKEICYLGYKTEEQQELSDKLIENYNKIKA